jgi:hypothetical protein
LRCDRATTRDDALIRRLLRESPFEGEVRLTLEREPNSFLAADIEGDVSQLCIVRDEEGGLPRAIGGRSVHDAWINGEPARLGYRSHLRVVGRPVGAGILRKGFARIRDWHQEGDAAFCVSMIVEDNRRARRILEAGLPGLPKFLKRERFVTLAIPVARRRRCRAGGPQVERGSSETLPEIVACLDRFGKRHQFAPRWSAESLADPRRTRGLELSDFIVARRNGEVRGCLARWDQRGFKQSVVHGYSRRLGATRPFLNLLSPWLNVPRLPAPGGRIESAFLSHVAIDDDDPEIFLALAESAYAEALETDLDYLVLGFADRHPLAEIVRRGFPVREYGSVLYLVHWNDVANGLEELDERVSHLEVAIL